MQSHVQNPKTGSPHLKPFTGARGRYQRGNWSLCALENLRDIPMEDLPTSLGVPFNRCICKHGCPLLFGQAPSPPGLYSPHCGANGVRGSDSDSLAGSPRRIGERNAHRVTAFSWMGSGRSFWGSGRMLLGACWNCQVGQDHQAGQRRRYLAGSLSWSDLTWQPRNRGLHLAAAV
jgi:hypothetical protein